jgi:predicted nucleic acid-binding protein
LDDRAARTVADRLHVATMTTQDLLRTAVAELILTPVEAKTLNQVLIDGGFRGDPQLGI